MAAASTKRQSTKKTARDQGVPDVYLGPNGKFRVGMDARYKSDLVNAALGIEDAKALATFEPADAKKRLRQRGWTPFLTRKQQRLAKEAKA